MKHQQVSVDYWAMCKAIIMYGGLTVMGWIMMRLFNTVFTLPRRMRAQQDHIQNTLAELQRRFPDLNITEEDLQNAEKELEEFIKEEDTKNAITESEITEEKTGEAETKVEKDIAESEGTGGDKKPTDSSTPPQIEDKKTI
ncbi:Uncharacterized protein OBRU01_17388 [Operophtera brumata]|uniref:Uncharacterized protein n=1 Tax=Operophtera brumata TaxID=104452 RepID=A0A0L7KWA6_OPEBR|nr:Uncharacterized protein OBRU01_17388 [Operophtera brumata]